MFDGLTGKEVERKVDEYSNVYGEILLGIHREHEKQKQELKRISQELDALKKSNDDLQTIKRRGLLFRVLSYAIGIILGLAVWILI